MLLTVNGIAVHVDTLTDCATGGALLGLETNDRLPGLRKMLGSQTFVRKASPPPEKALRNAAFSGKLAEAVSPARYTAPLTSTASACAISASLPPIGVLYRMRSPAGLSAVTKASVLPPPKGCNGRTAGKSEALVSPVSRILPCLSTAMPRISS